MNNLSNLFIYCLSSNNPFVVCIQFVCERKPEPFILSGTGSIPEHTRSEWWGTTWTHIHTYGQFRITISTVLLIFGHTGWLQAQTEHANEPSYCYQSENNICYCLADLTWLSGCDCSLMDMGCWLFLWWKPSRMTWHVLASPPHTGESSQLTERLHMLCISHTKVTVGCGERWRDRRGVGGGGNGQRDVRTVNMPFVTER